MIECDAFSCRQELKNNPYVIIYLLMVTISFQGSKQSKEKNISTKGKQQQTI